MCHCVEINQLSQAASIISLCANGHLQEVERVCSIPPYSLHDEGVQVVLERGNFDPRSDVQDHSVESRFFLVVF